MSSWKITEKLKKTHLSSPLSSFGRSPSQSTITDKDAKAQPQSGPSGTAPSPTPPDNNIASSEALTQTPVEFAPKPGILVVTLHEGRGFALPEPHKNIFSSHSTSASQGGGASIAGSVRTAPNGHRPNTSGGFGNVPTNHGRVSGKYMPYALLDFDKVQVFVNSVEGNPENPLWAGSNTQYKFDVSRVTDVTVHLYIRNPTAPPSVGRANDIFLGVVQIKPRFEEKHQFVEDPKANKKDREKAATEFAEKEKALGHSGVQWVPVGYGQGELKIGIEYVENRAGKLTIDDFDLLTVVGKGSFGKVIQVRKKDTSRIYALKTIRKAHIISRSEVTHTLAERSVLAQINNPFIVPLKFTFQSPEKLYFVLAFVNGGELFHHLQKEQRFDVNRSRFYTAELLCALECLHGFNVIYRDLKPENILLDYQGHIALCDFGLCKLDMKDEDRTNTFCGTPEYLAPELLMGQGYNKTVDWWTLGVLLYEMLTGLPPFYDENTNEMYRKILGEPLHFPSHDIVPPAAKDLLTKLLNRDPAQRLGANGSAEIKAHPFFHAIDWRKLLQRKYEPTFKPNVAGAMDTDNFDPEFTREAPQDSYVGGVPLSETMQNQFQGFSYNRPIAGLADGGGSVKDPSFIGSVTGR
ncbi:encodes protein serine/threonine kinase [Cryphonectria parasitica EP155]|uniref:non-specific serine/threonine protein kinase n=1 Tax=Cryphonectria parasitica (strain ATCC 38755 / EP155) TaxID=660469 RepID=A0A9P4Y5D4_CRYP1|nr:encodes protein serine/threonine kinase [Cryphonectria parasitica EP155]KAF3767242.1 encodes protein serine/threonine kinase [Cryphonectria parasitica EP155]